MKTLQIGLGSMGKRRIRNQLALNQTEIIGFDLREDRRSEAEKKYGIRTTGELTPDLLRERDAYIISTPPDRHNEYMKLAVRYGKPAFVEASVIQEGLMEIHAQARKKRVRIVPSATLRFHPAVKIMKGLCDSGKYGKVCSFVHHMGQYLPDWHPWEDIKSFYVSKKATSAAREMVSFEMTWLTSLIGLPQEVFAFKGKTMDLGVPIDDTYAYAVKFKGGLGVFLVDVVSRYATRSVVLNLEKAQIRWNWEDQCVKLFKAGAKDWEPLSYEAGTNVAGYNKNIAENMYIEELDTFFKDITGKATYPNTLREDADILSVLTAGEACGRGQKIKKSGRHA